jgi:phosphoglycolate phosphatase
MSRDGDVLLLWDIDGTLTSLVPDPILLFVRNLAAFPADLGKYPDASFTHGRSEREIVYEILRRNVGKRATDRLVTCAVRILQIRSSELRADYQELISPLPGVRAILQWCRAQRVSATVVTGNSFQAAVDKLSAARIDSLLELPCGGYADDRMERHELISEAISRSEEWFDRPIRRSRVVYIGDTPQDVQAASRAGVHSVAVATGEFSLAQLNGFIPVLSLRNMDADGAKLRELVDQLSRPVS